MIKRVAGDEPRQVRCAIYTRKSTEEGLELEFNSLDAQRDSAEAYIASQRAEGWVCLPQRYDDGGYTGGNIDRPALKRLMADIEAGSTSGGGLVDCVVVYKVDRLSRSLLDFARLMDVFERRGVSFVSVTQQFNTTHSMGRLTLNILLSFAQFERELISERTRDKIAAARRKGKWAGGRPVLGYDLVPGPGGSKLVVNPEEAQRVRALFELYLTLGSLMPVVAHCRERGWATKRWTTRAGKPQGGVALDKAGLYGLLTNPVYAGKVRHHTQVYEGEHEAIVEPDVFDRVQAQLRLHGQRGVSSAAEQVGHRTGPLLGSLLRGLVRCQACGCPMQHHYVSKRTKHGTKRYRYYVCRRAQKEGWTQCPAPSLPAGELERFVVDRLREVLTRDGTVDAVALRARDQLAAARPDFTVDPDELVGAAEAFDPVWSALKPRERAKLVGALVDRVEWDAAGETLTVVFREPAEATP